MYPNPPVFWPFTWVCGSEKPVTVGLFRYVLLKIFTRTLKAKWSHSTPAANGASAVARPFTGSLSDPIDTETGAGGGIKSSAADGDQVQLRHGGGSRQLQVGRIAGIHNSQLSRTGRISAGVTVGTGKDADDEEGVSKRGQN